MSRTMKVLASVLLSGLLALTACAPSAPAPASRQGGTTPSAETSAGSAAATSSAATSTAASSTAGAPTTAEVMQAATDQVTSNRSSVKVAMVKDVKIAKDAKGRWWASAKLVPDDQTKYDVATICLVKEGSKWAMVDFGVDLVSPAIPAEVLGKLK